MEASEAEEKEIATESQEEAFLGMSDEEFANLNTSEFANSEDESVGESDVDDSTEENSGEEDVRDDVYADSNDDSSSTDSDIDGDSDDNSDDNSDDEGSADGSETSEIEADADKYKIFVEQITTPFKANGKTMKVENAEDAIRLMQMGADYNRKMASMKPYRKVLKTLEQHDISGDKLNFLIDLDKKNPGAIAKLLQDSEIDPIDFNAEEAEKSYKATDYSPDERELALDQVLEEIKDSDTYNKTLDVVGGKWDDASKKAVSDSPEPLRVINDHMSNGIYDLISNQLEQDRILGRYTGLSDIEAYREVGDAIQARGGFDHLFQQEKGQQTPPPAQERSTEPQEEAKSRREKRRAAGPTKSAPSKKAPDFNPLGMSDDAFLEQIDERFI